MMLDQMEELRKKERHLGEINKQLKNKLEQEGAHYRAIQGPWESNMQVEGNYTMNHPQSNAMDCEPTLQIGMNNISFEEIRVDLVKGQQHSPEYKEINPMGHVPAIIDGDFILAESHAILAYIACRFSGVSDHWYPNDHINRAKINSILHWHHSNLRRGAESFVMATILGPTFGLRLNPVTASKAEKLLTSSLKIIENFWLKGSAKFLLGNPLPSIADLSLVCEIMELQMIYDKDWQRIFGPREKILQWIENVRNYTSPHFDEVHKVVYEYKERLQSKEACETGLTSKL